MTLEGLPLAELGKLFAIFGGAMVLLYILRLRRRRVQVPFSPLWSRVVVEKQSSSLFKALKRLGSLLVQLAVVALVVLALGDPKIGALGGCVNEDEVPPPPRHALLVLDASASMSTLEGGRTRLERAREEAHALVDKLAIHPSQRVMVVQLDAMTRPLSLWTSDPKALHEAIDRFAPQGAMDTPTAVGDALALAQDALRGKVGGELILVTDRAFEPIPQAQVESLGIRVIPVGTISDNVGIESFNVRPYLDDSVTYVAWYALRNETDRPIPVNLHLYANPGGLAEADFLEASRLVHTEHLVLPAREVLRGHLPELKFEGSRLLARLSVDSQDPLRDAFARDDIAFAVVPERRVLKVQLVSEGNLFVHAALFLRENIALTARTPAEYRGPEGFDVTVVDAADVDVSRPGNYFLIEPKARDGFEIASRLLEPQVDKVDKKHPLARHLGLADANILETPVYATAKKDQVVAAAKGGAPLLFARVDAAGGRRFVVLSFDVRKSLFPMSYSFPILVVNAISWFWQDPEGLLQPNRAGLPLSVAFPGQAATPEVLGPLPGVGARRVGERVHFTAPRLGIWQLTEPAVKDGEAAKTLPVAVNLLSPEESRIAPRGEYPAWTAPTWVPPQRNEWLAEFWRVLLLAALGVVLIEWFTWHRRWTV